MTEMSAADHLNSPTHHLQVDTHGVGALAPTLVQLHRQQASSPAPLLGMWSVEYGLVNRVVSLWGAAAVTATDEGEVCQDWLDHARVLRRLQQRRPLRLDLLDAPFMEMRLYSTLPGRCEEFVSMMLRHLPFRERYSPCAGVWTTRERGRDVVVHLWAYRNFEERSSARVAAAADPDWARYRTWIKTVLHSMQVSWLARERLPADGAIA